MSTVVAAPVRTTREEIDALMKISDAQWTRAQGRWKRFDWVSSVIGCGMMVDGLTRQALVTTTIGMILGSTLQHFQFLSAAGRRISEFEVQSLELEKLSDKEKKEIVKIVKTALSMRATHIKMEGYSRKLGLAFLCSAFVLKYLIKVEPLVFSYKALQCANAIYIGFVGSFGLLYIIEKALKLYMSKLNITQELKKENEKIA